MAEVKWIKILVDIFDDEAIKLIEQMPDGDTLLVIWFKLLAKAGKTNDGGLVYLKENIPYTDEILATVFNKPIATIRLAMQTFRNLGMVELTNEHQILITNWEKHQNIDGLAKVREQARMRMQKSREKQKLLLENKNDVTQQLRNNDATVTENVTQENVTVANDVTQQVTQQGVTVAECYATDIEVDKDKDKELNTTTITTTASENSENEHNFYGEYCNVGLTKAQYGKLLTFILDQKTLDNLIETFGKKIETGDEKKFTTELPNMHFERLLAYWKYMKLNPQKFTDKKQDSAPAETKNEAFSLRKFLGKGA